MSTANQINNDTLALLVKSLEAYSLGSTFDSDVIDQDLLVDRYSRRTIVYKIGKYSKKTIRHLRRRDTKASILIATWVVESVAYAVTFMLLLSSGSVITAALWSALYCYVTYSFFSLLKDSMMYGYFVKGFSSNV